MPLSAIQAANAAILSLEAEPFRPGFSKDILSFYALVARNRGDDHGFRAR